MEVHLAYHKKKKKEIIQNQSLSPLQMWNQMNNVCEDKIS